MTRRLPGLPDIAMVLAAGLGTRLKPITKSVPKPLVQVAGRTLIDRVLDRLVAADVRTAIVNVHYKAEMLKAHLDRRATPDIRYSDETDRLLDTGGGVARALPLLANGPLLEQRPFLVVNSDVMWRDAFVESLAVLGRRWHDDTMDALLLLQPTITADGYRGAGDFTMEPDGALLRRNELRVAPFVFAGVQILHPRLFADVPDGPFSLNLLYDRAQEAGRLYGVRHEGDWLHVGTLEGFRLAERTLIEDWMQPGAETAA